jgi:hypothetical protein
MSEPEYIDPRQLRSGPIQHESLPPELLERIQAVYNVIGPYVNITLEQFEIAFMRDTHPEREVDIWCCIAAAWIAYHKEYLGNELLPDEAEKDLVAALVAISTGVEDVQILRVPEDVGRKLMACYDGLGKE